MGITIITSAIVFNTLTPISDQERISPNNIHVISSKQVMRVKRNINYCRGLSVDPVTNSQN